MFLPAGAGLAGLIAVAIFNRRAIPIALIALFVSGALAKAGLSASAYGTFMGLFLGALTIYAIRQEERVIEKVLGLYLGIAIIWASDNAAISQALAGISYFIVLPFFNALVQAIGEIGIFGAGLAGLLAWSLFAPRLMHIAEEEPLLAIGYVMLGYTVLSALVASVPDYLRLGLALGLLNQWSRALRGNLEALGEVAPALFLLTGIIDKAALAGLGSVLAIVELGFGVLSRKHLAGSAMWATAVTLI